nr:hypothetical protein Iba_chr06cCG5310 [Ipomoea batatas]
MIGPPATMANRLSSQRMSEEWPDQDYIPRDPPVNPSPNLSVSDGNWSDIQRWYQENHTHEQGLSPPPRNRQPRVEDYDEDYLRYLQDIPEEEEDEEDFIHSSVQENETGYTPRPPKYDSDTMECLVKKKQKKVNSSKAEDTQEVEPSAMSTSRLETGNEKKEAERSPPTSVDVSNVKETQHASVSQSLPPLHQLLHQLMKATVIKMMHCHSLDPSQGSRNLRSSISSSSSSTMVEELSEGEEDDVDIVPESIKQRICATSPLIVAKVLISSIRNEPPRPPIDASKKDSPDDSSNSSGLNDSDANHNENQPKEEDESRRIEDESNIAENKGQSTHAMSSPPRGVAEQRNEEIIFAAPLAVILPQICDVTHDPTISKTEELAQQSDSDEKAAKYLLELIITSS